MRAFVKSAPGPRGGRVDLVDDPVPGDGDVVVQVAAVGLCGTDVSVYNWWPSIVDIYRPRLPLILGHEFGGRVSSVGAQVVTVQPGDLVSVIPLQTCDACYYCRNGLSNICENRRVIGIHRHGGLAEQVAVPARNVVLMPPGSAETLLAVWEPFAVAQHALTRAPVSPETTVVVVGPGMIGLMLALATLSRGVARCVVVGRSRDAQRLAIAARLGAESINADETDPMPIIRRATGGKGADVVFESAGQPAGVALSLLAVRPRGRVCLIGTPHEPTPVHTGAVCASEIEIVGSRAHSPEGLAEAIRLIPDLQNWVHVFDFERFPLARADEALSAAEDSVNPKVLVQP